MCFHGSVLQTVPDEELHPEEQPQKEGIGHGVCSFKHPELALATRYTISKPFTGVPIVTSIHHLTNHLWYYSACSGQILFVERSVPREHKRGRPARPQAQVSMPHPQLPGQGTAAQRTGTRRQGAPPHHGIPQASQEWDHPAAKAAAL